MRYPLPVLLVMLLALPGRPAAAQEAADDGIPTDNEVPTEAVDAAIARGVAWLYTQQNDNGSFEQTPSRQGDTGHGVKSGQWGGLTGLAAYTLLAAGESPRDERVDKATRFLMDAEIVGNYALGVRALVWPYLPPSDDVKQAALRDAKLLLANVQKQGKNRGLYDYLGNENERVDLSASQYGVLGMWAASDYVEIPIGYWQEVERAWLNWQQPDGGWAYAGRPQPGKKPVTASMTAAGIATLYLTQDFLIANQPAQTRGNLQNPSIDKAMDLMIEHYPELLELEPETPFTEHGGGLYTLYGVERIGVASGRKYFGELDWYASGARYLLDDQKRDGNWGNLQDTCFALLFLARGREPVMMNKAQYALEPRPGRQVEASWNQRPRDLANVARWVGKQTERTLNWQVIDLGRGTVRDLHDAPILLMAGDQPLALTEETKAEIEQYLKEGGLLVLNPDGGSKRFEQSAVELGNAMFGDEGYAWRTLPADHPILADQQFNTANWRRQPEVMGLTNGVRELMVLLPNDAAAAWQTYDTRAEEDFQLAANLYLYAIDKDQTYFKGDTHLLEPEGDAPARTINVARIEHAGNWNPEPAAWDQFAAYAHNEAGFAIETRTVPLINLAGLDPAEVPVAHLTGTGKPELAEGAAEALKAYVDAGGSVVIDAAGGDGDFAAAAEALIGRAFGEAALAEVIDDPLPPGHPLYDAGPELADVGYRDYAIDKIVGPLDEPRLRGLTVDDRLAIVYSPEDLTAGLLGAPVDGIYGYDLATAKPLMAKVLGHLAGE